MAEKAFLNPNILIKEEVEERDDLQPGIHMDSSENVSKINYFIP